MSDSPTTNECTNSTTTGDTTMTQAIPYPQDQGAVANLHSQDGTAKRHRKEDLQREEGRVAERRREVAEHFAMLWTLS